jgi:hypothetical protein
MDGLAQYGSTFARAQMQPRAEVILTVTFRDFRQSFKVWAATGHDRFFAHPFQSLLTHHPIIRRYVVWYADNVVQKTRTH